MFWGSFLWPSFALLSFALPNLMSKSINETKISYGRFFIVPNIFKVSFFGILPNFLNIFNPSKTIRISNILIPISRYICIMLKVSRFSSFIAMWFFWSLGFGSTDDLAYLFSYKKDLAWVQILIAVLNYFFLTYILIKIS